MNRKHAAQPTATTNTKRRVPRWLKWTGGIFLGMAVIGSFMPDQPEATPSTPTAAVTSQAATVAPTPTAAPAAAKKAAPVKATTAAPTQAPETQEPETQEPAEPAVSPEFEAALEKAQMYSDTMHMSKRGLMEQLTSDFGEQFPKDAAKYAVENVQADFKANALEKARSYRDDMSMSKAAVRDQLVSDFGEKFTTAEADYAVKNLE